MGTFEQQIQTLIRSRNGVVLIGDRRIGHLEDTVRLTCESRHTWSTTAGALLRGGWCAKCQRISERRMVSFARISAAVEKRGGRLVTRESEFKGVAYKADFECSAGHRWRTAAISVLGGSWCKECYFARSSLGLAALVKFAESRGGRVISATYVSASSAYTWECKVGHRFELTFPNAKRGSWCQACNPFPTTKKTLVDMQALALKHGGKCISDSYINNTTKLRWRCERGHEWETTPAVITKGAWCPTCDRIAKATTITDLVKFAREKAGECLSDEFQGAQSTYRWRCKAGHEFELSYLYAKKEAWCPTCLRNEKRAAFLERVRILAHTRRGECVSPSFEQTSIPLRWRCEKGHEWNAKYSNIERGGWCPECARDSRRGDLEEYHKIAKARGGACLSTLYVSNRDKLLFRCDGGHEWEAIPYTVKKGAWCPVCAGRAKKTLEDAVQLAKCRGGLCLSPNFPGRLKKLLWQCAKGHQWRAAFANVASGSWCPICSRGTFTFSELEAAARAKGGKVLSTPKDYENGSSFLLVRCKDGHAWQTRALRLGKGNWCRQCSANKLRTPIEEIRAYAESRGGRLLTEKLSTQKGRSWVFFQCEKGHGWRANGGQVVRAGSWCRKCKHESRKHSIEEMQGIASARGGECLSKVYLNAITKLDWRCAAGHVWSTTPAIVLGGAWCEKCTSPNLNSIEKLRALAREKGGWVLSKEFLGSQEKHEFRCGKGHRWWALAGSIKMGRWCSECAQCKPGTIEEMRSLASKHGGECLSEEYVNNKTTLLWRCGKGHEFSKKPHHVKVRGQWCSICSGKRKGATQRKSLDPLSAALDMSMESQESVS